MKALKYTIKDLQKGLNLFKNNKYSFLSLNKTNLNLRNVNNNNILNTFKRTFAENSNKNDDETHSDFKPKSKIEITEDNVMQMIDGWIKNYDVVLFMNGTWETPIYGFSNYIVKTLKFYKITNVKCVNVLKNPIVEEALKKSNLNSCPLLYVKGNLVGDYSTFKEMHWNGSLKELVEREKIGGKFVYA